MQVTITDPESGAMIQLSGVTAYSRTTSGDNVTIAVTWLSQSISVTGPGLQAMRTITE